MASAVVVGFIRTPEGEAAIEAAAAEAGRRGGRLVVVHSAKGGHEDEASVVADRDALAVLAERLTAQGLDVAIEDLARGHSPADDLVAVAETEQAELVVIGVRRRTPVGKLILGSIAQEVLLKAPCQVLAVKAPHGE